MHVTSSRSNEQNETKALRSTASIDESAALISISSSQFAVEMHVLHVADKRRYFLAGDNATWQILFLAGDCWRHSNLSTYTWQQFCGLRLANTQQRSATRYTQLAGRRRRRRHRHRQQDRSTPNQKHINSSIIDRHLDRNH